MSATASIVSECPIAQLRATVRPGSSSDTGTTEFRHFPRHCIDEFEWLARNAPGGLVRLAMTELVSDPVLLSQSAEAMALCHRPALAVPALMKLLTHERPFVRESALMGLAPFLSESLQARDRVRAIAEFDISPGVREAAADVLRLL